jgi:hypothetical protein
VHKCDKSREPKSLRRTKASCVEERERAEDASPGGVGVSSAVSPGGQRLVRHVQGGGAGHLGVPPASKPDVYKNGKSTIGWGVGKC